MWNFHIHCMWLFMATEGTTDFSHQIPSILEKMSFKSMLRIPSSNCLSCIRCDKGFFCSSWMHYIQSVTNQCIRCPVDFLYLTFTKQNVFKKGGAKIIQQWETKRPVGEESWDSCRPEQTGGCMEGEKFHQTVRLYDVFSCLNRKCHAKVFSIMQNSLAI